MVASERCSSSEATSPGWSSLSVWWSGCSPVVRLPHKIIRAGGSDRCAVSSTAALTMRYSRPYFELTSRIAAAMKLTHLMKAAERMRREYKQLGLRFAGGLLVVIGVALVAPRALAQQSALPRVGGEATRGDLQGYLAECERLASTSSISVEARQSYRRNAEVVRERLSDGDFRVGDLIVL